MASASAPVRQDHRQPPRQQPSEFIRKPSWGEGAASALRVLRSLEQRRYLTRPIG